ncbi:uncharacterized protein TNIN_71511 [Trichonephila inaurata madagascariensis]|uniref:Uncharacterized protein n=1 Tax=Trichonephila inaurata madagascariensis TaxID=2747483 RepID=A0A8X6JV17_9ARAC|nr:uncharacterized protein TNIN_71511 [Trichonephila inaurata madagascariensis]
MRACIKCLIFLIIIDNVLASEESSRNSFKTVEKLLAVQKIENPPQHDYGATDSSKDELSADSESTLYKSKPRSGGDYPLFNEYNDQIFNHGISSIPSISPDIKGNPFSVPSWITPDQMVQMMAAIKNMSDATKSVENGLFSKLITDPKIAAAAFIPLSIVAAAIVPVLMNYVMGNTTPVSVSTTANNRMFKSFDTSENLQEIMEIVSKISPAVNNNYCIQKNICRVFMGVADAPKSDYAHKIAPTINLLITKYGVNVSIFKEIVEGIKTGKCDDLCKRSVIIYKRELE